MKQPTIKLKDYEKLVRKSILAKLKEVRECRSNIGLHICKKHPEDCEFFIEWSKTKKVIRQ